MFRRLHPTIPGVLALIAAAAALASEAGALPEPWKHRDIGAVSVAGSASHSGGGFTLAGTLDIWTKADGFHFVYQPLDGDGEIVARVMAVENTNNHAKGGVTIRESLEPGARHATMVVTAVDGTQFLVRKDADDVTVNISKGKNINRGMFPYWVKLVRTGDVFKASESTDGREWIATGEVTLPIGKSAFVGLVSSSHQKTVTSTAKIDHVELKH